MVGEFGGDVPFVGRAGGAGRVGWAALMRASACPACEAVEAHAGLAGAVDGGDTVFGAAAEALDVSHGRGSAAGFRAISASSARRNSPLSAVS